MYVLPSNQGSQLYVSTISKAHDNLSGRKMWHDCVAKIKKGRLLLRTRQFAVIQCTKFLLIVDEIPSFISTAFFRAVEGRLLSKNPHSLFTCHSLKGTRDLSLYIVGWFRRRRRCIAPGRVQPSVYSTGSSGNNKDMVSSDGSTKPLNIATGIIVHWANMNIICIFDMGVGGVKSPSFYVMWANNSKVLPTQDASWSTTIHYTTFYSRLLLWYTRLMPTKTTLLQVTRMRNVLVLTTVKTLKEAVTYLALAILNHQH